VRHSTAAAAAELAFDVGAREPVDEVFGDSRREHCFAGADGPNGVEQRLRQEVLE
jgi:hypothetical protein